MERHNCGGVLARSAVVVNKRFGNLVFQVVVHGKRCRACGEELVSRDTAKALEEVPSLIGSQRRRRKGQGFVVHFATPNIVAWPLVMSTSGNFTHQSDLPVDTQKVAYA